MQDSEASSLNGHRWGGLGCSFDLQGQGDVHESETVGNACVVALSSCLLGRWCCRKYVTSVCVRAGAAATPGRWVILKWATRVWQTTNASRTLPQQEVEE